MAMRRAETPPPRRYTDYYAGRASGFGGRDPRLRASAAMGREDEPGNAYCFDLGYVLARVVGLPIYFSGVVVYVALWPVLLMAMFARWIARLLAPIVLLVPRLVLWPVYFLFQCIACAAGMCITLAVIAQLLEMSGAEPESSYLRELLRLWAVSKAFVLGYLQTFVASPYAQETLAWLRKEAETKTAQAAGMLPDSVTAAWATIVAADYRQLYSDACKSVSPDSLRDHWYKLQVDAVRIYAETKEAMVAKIPEKATWEDMMLLARHALPMTLVLVAGILAIRVFLVPALTLVALLTAIALAPVRLFGGFVSGAYASTAFWRKVLTMFTDFFTS
eukprot:TRINITY_DN75924_c0_g1_i1.p1 TRINITY_DN75924_c0_g1~~TRINITY_DN75924_c0_g1_i1.p1  ORF type:complete len:354 (-),score=59.59 TRINITY_DN75924_c0_g1_i1:101-1099(-)